MTSGGEVGWLVQVAADVPDDDTWLTDRERHVLVGLRLDHRRRDWRLGRWTAKAAVAAWLVSSRPPGSASPDSPVVEILAADDGSPEVWLPERCPAPVAISLSHRDGVAACTVAPTGKAVGCDLELVEARSAAFVAEWFTSEEQALMAATSLVERPLVANLLWSAKESVLKALREGLRLDPRDVAVRLHPPSGRGWSGFEAHWVAGPATFTGWWRHLGPLVLTVAGAEDQPTPLRPAVGPTDAAARRRR